MSLAPGCRIGESAEVAIIGGGPSGTSAAIALARAGREVVVLERSRYDLPRVGETFPPSIRPVLETLAVWDEFLTEGHLAAPGIVSAWEEPSLVSNDFVFSPYGVGWHVDRRRFDAMLARAAEAKGARLFRGAEVRTVDQDDHGPWRIAAMVDGSPVSLIAGFLVDATGRSSAPSRRLGARRINLDRLVGVVGWLAADASGIGHDRRALIEAVQTGWWYSSLVPGDRLIASWMTDSDLLAAAADGLAAAWSEALTGAPHTANRVGRAVPEGSLRVVPANSSRIDRPTAPGRLAVGEAAVALDPLSGLGVHEALRSGLHAARVIDGLLRSGHDEPEPYDHHVIESFDRLRQARREYYGRVRRWPQSPFWTRRQGAAPAFGIVTAGS